MKKQQNPMPEKPKFDASGIGLIPIGFPGEFGFSAQEPVQTRTHL